MAEYFTARGLPVPRELQQNPLTDWRRLSLIAAVLLVLYIGLRITDIDTGRAEGCEVGFAVLLLVGDHQVGAEGEDPVDLGVLRAADAGDVQIGRVTAPVRRADEQACVGLGDGLGE